MSSSDSETSSDESADQNVFEFFSDMKKCINRSSNNSKDIAPEEVRKASSPTVSKRQQLYDTFKKPETLSHTKNPESEQKFGFYVDKGKQKSDVTDSFFIDKSTHTTNNTETTDNSNTVNNIEIEVVNLSDINIKDEASDNEEDSELVVPHKSRMKKKEPKELKLSSAIQTSLASKELYVNVAAYEITKEQVTAKKKSNKEPSIMQKSVITEEFEKQDAIATTHVSKRQEKRERRLERSKTKGDKWFNLPATELTEERKNDLEVLHMRKALDPKRFYKGNDMKSIPKFFQFGTVVESKADFYHSRIPKKQRKSTIVEELLADADFRKFNKRKYSEIQEAKRMGQGPYKHMKRLKKRKR